MNLLDGMAALPKVFQIVSEHADELERAIPLLAQLTGAIQGYTSPGGFETTEKLEQFAANHVRITRLFREIAAIALDSNTLGDEGSAVLEGLDTYFEDVSRIASLSASHVISQMHELTRAPSPSSVVLAPVAPRCSDDGDGAPSSNERTHRR